MSFVELKQKFTCFFTKVFRDLQTNVQKIAIKKVETAAENHIHVDYKVSQQEMDAFRMKAIVLLKKDEMVGISINNLLKSPVEVTVNQVKSDKLVIKLSQAFIWSGKTFQLQGEFEKDPQKKTYSIPIPASFKICKHPSGK